MLPWCPSCPHVQDCEIAEELNCTDVFHFDCWCREAPKYGDTCSGCQHRKHCFEPDCEESPHCDCRVEQPSVNYCVGCSHTLNCETPDCEGKTHLFAQSPKVYTEEAPGIIAPSTELVSTIEKLEQLRNAKNSAEKEYNKLRKELLEGPLRGVSGVLDPSDNNALWLEIVTKESLIVPKSALNSLSAEFPEAYGKYVKSTKATYLVFKKAHRLLWWLGDKKS